MKKRIALVVNTLSGGGAEKVVSNLSLELSAWYEVDIIVNEKIHIDYDYKGKVISLNMPESIPRMGIFYQILVTLKRAAVLRWLKKERGYQAVISFSEMTNLSNVLSGNKYSKTIVTKHNSIRLGEKSGWKSKLVTRYILPFVCRKADVMVSCSKEIAKELEQECRLNPKKSVIIYNGIDIDGIRELASAKISAKLENEWKGKKLLVTAGRLTYAKGQWHLLKVIKLLKDKGLPVKLLLLGEGEFRPLLEKEIKALGLGNDVFMPGFVKNPYKYMARADVVVMSSLYEGFSNVLVEALACGAAVISTDHETGAREILAPDTDYRRKIKDRIEEAEYGILVPVAKDGIKKSMGNQSVKYSREERLMAEGVQMLLNDKIMTDCYRQSAHKRAEQLDMKCICKQWIHLIEMK